MFVQNHHTHTHTPSHTIFHRTPSFTHNFHIQLSNCSILHHLLCLCFLSLPTRSSVLTQTYLFHNFFTRKIITHHLSHTSLSQYFLSHASLPHTALHIQPFNSSIIHHFLCLSFVPRPAGTFCFCLLEEVDLWGYPVLHFSRFQKVVSSKFMFFMLSLFECFWLFAPIFPGFLRRGLSAHHLPLLRLAYHCGEPGRGLQANQWKDPQREIPIFRRL